jgi:hypothetical protein
MKGVRKMESKFYSTLRFNMEDMSTLAEGLRQYLKTNTCNNQLNAGAGLLSKVNLARTRLEKLANAEVTV